MSKQKTEKLFREAVLKHNKDVHIQKIQVNTHAFTSTTADFFIQTKKHDIMVECKETKINNKFQISRLKQETKLINFQKRFKRNKSYIFLTFVGRKHLCFLISIDKWIKFRQQNNIKMISCEDVFINFFDEYCEDWKIKL